ncbi:MAG: hypothetical protein JW888_02200 [Pirellulales bacterium]|nr:hypothetical protein [Pirellulales bacterium]
MTAEPSLDAPPVYRRFLAGGTESLWPGRLALVVLLLVGAALLGAAWWFFLPKNDDTRLVFLSNAVGALVCSGVLAIFASRWLGRRLGVLSGFVWLGSVGVLRGHVDTWLAVLFCLALGLFATAQVPGRLATIFNSAIAWAFYTVISVSFLLFGVEVSLLILAICIVFVLSVQDTRSTRFFVNPIGLGILILTVVGRGFVGQHLPDGYLAAPLLADWAFHADPTRRWVTIVVDFLPWLPLALVAVAVGIRQGHYGTPFWRFLSCWVLVSVGLTAFGMTTAEVVLAAVMPPTCILAAAGLAQTIIHTRRFQWGWPSRL